MDPAERSAIIRRGRQLEEDHLHHVKRAALLLDAESSWQKVLNASERRDRDYVILALQSENPPDAVKWGNFDRNFSNNMKNDREIFLLRLEKGFQEHYGGCAYSKLPVPFRNDKEVMLKVVSKSSMTLSVASEELRNDRDVVMAALQNQHERAPHSIQYASKKLQGDKRIARTMLSHEYGITAFSRLPRKLQQDYSLVVWGLQSMGDECKFEALKELPEEMLDDYDIVYEAVKSRGSNLRFIQDESLLNDADIVMAACENDGAAIAYVPKGPTRDELLEESNLLILLQNGGHCVLKELGDEYMMDRKYLLPAVENGMVLKPKFARKLFQKDRALFMDVLCHSNQPFQLYFQLPSDIVKDASVGLAILEAQDEGSWAHRFFKEIPEHVARIHIDTLMSLAKNEDVPFNSRNSGFWDVKEIALALCKIKGDWLDRVSGRLKSDVDVVKAAFSSGSVPVWIIGRVVPQTVYRENHDLAAMAIKACKVKKLNWRDRSDIIRQLGQDAINSRAVVLEALKKGWQLYGRTNPFSNNREVALEAIKNGDPEHVGEIITEFSRHFRNDREFMLAAVRANPFVLKYAPEQTLLGDFDYMLAGVSQSKHVLKPFVHKGKEFDFLADFAQAVRARLAVTDGFIIEFLGAISISPANRKRPNKRRRAGRQPCRQPCHLPLLDLGYETGSVIKRKIAEFADVPVGPDIKLLRAALDNLKFWGY